MRGVFHGVLVCAALPLLLTIGKGVLVLCSS